MTKRPNIANVWNMKSRTVTLIWKKYLQPYDIFRHMRCDVPQSDVCDEKTGGIESLLSSHVPITLRAELILNAFVMPQSLLFKPVGKEWDGYLMI